MWKKVIFCWLCWFGLGIYFVHSEDRESAITRKGLTFESVVLGRHGRKCYDFCSMISSMCRNGGSCITDQHTCDGKCICAPGWTGKWCKDKINDTELKEQEIGSDITEPVTNSEPNWLATNIPVTSAENDETKLTTNNNVTNISGFGIKPSLILTTEHTNTSSLIKATVTTKTDDVTTENDDEITKQEARRMFQIREVQGSSFDNKSEIESCIKSCKNGECIKIDNIYKCKQHVNATNDEALKKCNPGFVCEHGICDFAGLEENSYRCICERNYVGQFCTLKCPLDCGDHGHCDVHIADNTYKCYCQWNYTGVNCSELIPEDIGPPLPDEITFHWYVVASSVSVVVVTIATMFLLAYVMWRRRLVFMLKIVHYFQHYEEDDGKEFDAFVSYKSCPRDEHFVLHQLYPKLETEFKFKLCMHFRDFLPGEAIANNIVKAIESSRRTIIVLSPEYVKSEWCRMEYQKAQHEMLKLKHKIIPVVLDDISDIDNIDKNLKSILSSVTYLEWPGSDNSKKVEKFWKKLELSLPKKSSSSSSSSESISFSHPAAESNIYTSDILSPSSSSSLSENTSRAAVRLATDSPTLSSVTTSSNSPKFLKNKRKDFRHFMGKLVQTKIFGRQDSNSSQAALVDEETIGSRSICGSVSESMLSESSESLCSSSDIPSKYLDEIREGQVNNTFIKAYAYECHTYENVRRSSLRKPRVSMDVIEKENIVINECEKDHCDDTECEMCSKTRHVRNTPDSVVDECFETTDTSAINDMECDYCEYMRNRSDNNRIQISAMDGYQQLKIQKLPYTFPNCPCCNQLLERSVPYRGSMKERKDAKNLKIMNEKKRRVGSLPRNYKNSRIQAKQDGGMSEEGKNNKSDSKGAQCDGSSISYVNEGYIVDVCEEL